MVWIFFSVSYTPTIDRNVRKRCGMWQKTSAEGLYSNAWRTAGRVYCGLVLQVEMATTTQRGSSRRMRACHNCGVDRGTEMEAMQYQMLQIRQLFIG